MLFDTHCHLNIDVLAGKTDDVVAMAKKNGIEKILIPGVTLDSSKSAIEISEKYEGVYAGVGIHPTDDEKNSRTPKHQNSKERIFYYISELEKIITKDKVLAVGEIGLDYHVRNKEEGVRSEAEKEIQKELFIAQLKLALEYKKPVILHSRESKNDLLFVLNEYWSDSFSQKMVFHCCEPDIDLLNFAKEKNIFIGIDGDITYKPEKQEFVKIIPKELLVLETDSPFLIPEPLRSQKIYPNEPKNIRLISDYICDLLGKEREEFEKQVWENSNKLFFN